MKMSFLGTMMTVGLTCVASAQQQNFVIDWFAVAGRGGTSTGGIYSIGGTIGQPNAGPASGGSIR